MGSFHTPEQALGLLLAKSNMNNKYKKSEVEGLDFQTALNINNCVTYRLRTECQFDADLVRTLLSRWLLAWSETAVFVDAHGEKSWNDVDVEFRLRKSAPNVKSLRWLIDQLPDCHVASQTLDLAHRYTGERSDHDSVLSTNPPEAFLASICQDAVSVTRRLGQQRKVISALSKTLGVLR